MSNIDSRNTKRGRCMVENCDCDRFEQDLETKRPLCFYCGCLSAKHIRIEGTKIN